MCLCKNFRSGDTTARIWNIPEGPLKSSRSISALILKHAKGKSNEKSKDVTTLDWNVSAAVSFSLLMKYLPVLGYCYFLPVLYSSGLVP